MNSINDFDIKNGVLRLYIGSDTDVTVPDGVTKIGKKAFESCSELKSVVIPAGVTEIGESAFENCFELKKVSLPDGLKTICKRAFAYCGIESLHFPDSVTAIGERAFDACINFSSITVPEGTAKLDELAFGEWMIIKSFYFKNRLFEDIPDGYRFRNSLQGFAANYKKDKAGSEIINSYIRYFRAELCGEIGLGYVADNTELVQFAAEQQALSAEEAEILLSMLPEKESGKARTVLTEYISSRKKEDNLQPGGTSLKDIVKEWSFRNNADGTVTLTKYFGSKTDIVCPSYICGRPVTEISYKLFRNTRVRSVILPDGLTRLHDGIFFNCTNLTSVTVPEGVTGIGKKAFYSCRSLSSLKLPDSVTEIGEDAFCDCRSLTAINVPDGVKSIGSRAFEHCYALRSVAVHGIGTQIGKDAFCSCSKYTTFYFKNRLFDCIPEEYRNFGSAAGFAENCKNDKQPNMIINSYVSFIKKNICNIGSEYILGYSALLRFAVDYSALTAEEAELFLSLLPENHNAELRAVLIEYAGSQKDNTDTLSLTWVPLAEIHNDWLFIKNEDQTATLTKYIGENTDVICPDGIGDRAVTEIAENALAHSDITSVIIPEGIKKVGSSAFDGCSRLKSVKLPKTLEYLGDSAFKNCTGLRSVKLPLTLSHLGDSAFKGCTNLGSIKIPKGITQLGKEAFCNCRSLKTVTVPGNITDIGEGAFRNCSLLLIASLSPGVTTIKAEAFKDCSCLAVIELPDSVTELGDSVFENCRNLQSLIIPDSVVYAGSSICSFCTSLKSVTFSKQMTDIPHSAFSYCTSLETADIPDSIISVSPYAFSYCITLDTAVMGKSTQCHPDAFFNTPNVKIIRR